MDALPEWPKPIKYEMSDKHYWVSEYPLTSLEIIEYERARAEAAIARLKVAVEALSRISDHDRQDGVCDTWHADAAHAALAQIGPLPLPTLRQSVDRIREFTRTLPTPSMDDEPTSPPPTDDIVAGLRDGLADIAAYFNCLGSHSGKRYASIAMQAIAALGPPPERK